MQLKSNITRYIITAVILVLFIVFAIRLNSVTKIQLVNRTGQTFETGVVVDILQDNIQEDGARIGQQVVDIQMTSGEKTGQSSGHRLRGLCGQTGPVWPG